MNLRGVRILFFYLNCLNTSSNFLLETVLMIWHEDSMLKYVKESMYIIKALRDI